MVRLPEAQRQVISLIHQTTILQVLIPYIIEFATSRQRQVVILRCRLLLSFHLTHQTLLRQLMIMMQPVQVFRWRVMCY